jgi:hypothetical protein
MIGLSRLVGGAGGRVVSSRLSEAKERASLRARSRYPPNPAASFASVGGLGHCAPRALPMVSRLGCPEKLLMVCMVCAVLRLSSGAMDMLMLARRTVSPKSKAAKLPSKPSAGGDLLLSSLASLSQRFS